MKILVAYYSRTEKTKKVAEYIKKELGADIEEIVPVKGYSGKVGYARGCVDAPRGKTPEIKPIKSNPSDYDLVIIGTPVWCFTMASPVLTYIRENKDKFKDVAFFATAGSTGMESTLKDMETESKKPLNSFYLTKLDINKFENKVDEFIKGLN